MSLEQTPPSIQIPNIDRCIVNPIWDIKYGKGYFIYISTDNPVNRINKLFSILKWVYSNIEKLSLYNVHRQVDEIDKIHNLLNHKKEFIGMYKSLYNKNIEKERQIDYLRYVIDKSLPILYITTEIFNSYLPKNWEDGNVKLDESYLDICNEFLSQFNGSGISLEYNLDFISCISYYKQ